jgi:arylsulfatase A-like enzyme
VPNDLYRPLADYPGAAEHGSTGAPTRFAAEHSQTAFLVEAVEEWLERHGAAPFFVHLSFLRPHPPRRNPAGYHDRYDADALPPFVAVESPEAEAAGHPFVTAVFAAPQAAAPLDERERRQIRATYYGAMAEVDDWLGDLFARLERLGLLDSTLVVLTSDHGEMGGDHWLLEKLAFYDETYDVPLVVVDPDPAADGTRGSVVHEVTDAVDVLPTVCEALGLEVPERADGWSLGPFLREGRAPAHWRSTAPFECDFSHPIHRAAERRFGVPMAPCSLAVARSARTQVMQFAAEPEVFPPIVDDLAADPHQLCDLGRTPAGQALAAEGAAELLRWRMRHDDRTLSGYFLDPTRGLVHHRDPWR